jgi:hypothetical protein
MLLAAGGVLVYLIEARGLRLFLLAAGCLFGSAYLTAAGCREPLAVPGPLWPAGLAAALLAGAIRHRDFRCLLGSALSVGAFVAAFRPGETLIAYGGIAAGLWLAIGSWIVFPSLRRWVPVAATILVLGIGAWMLWRELPGAIFACGGLAATAAGVGIAVRRPEFLGAGISGGAVLAAFKHGSWIPASSVGWGVLLLTAGFVFLTVGVGVNLLLARHRSRADAGTPAPVESPP